MAPGCGLAIEPGGCWGVAWGGAWVCPSAKTIGASITVSMAQRASMTTLSRESKRRTDAIPRPKRLEVSQVCIKILREAEIVDLSKLRPTAIPETRFHIKNDG